MFTAGVFFRVLLFEPTVVKNCRELRPNIGKVPFSWATILVGFKGIQVEGEMNIATSLEFPGKPKNNEIVHQPNDSNRDPT